MYELWMVGVVLARLILPDLFYFFMVRETSLEAYEKIKTEIGDRQLKVFDAIKELDGCTDLEIATHLKYSDPNRVRPRRNELMKKGFIKQSDSRQCSISGHNAMTWVISSDEEIMKEREQLHFCECCKTNETENKLCKNCSNFINRM